MENEELTTIEIDLSEADNVSESWLKSFGFGIKSIMNYMFGGPKVPITVKGTKSQIKDFSRVLGREKRYLQDYKKFGLDNPQTYRSKYKLKSAISKFERSTGITWPFK